MVLCPASCPTKIHCAAAFVLLNGKFSKLGVTLSHTPFCFVPEYEYALEISGISVTSATVE